MNNAKKPFRIAKWIMLTFAVLLNSFIIVYSSLDDKTTNMWSRSVSNLFTSFINTFTHRETKVIRAESIETVFTDSSVNHIPGYQIDEIPLGTEKEIFTNVLPANTTNKSIEYRKEDDGIAIKQNGANATVIGLEKGESGVVASWNNDQLYEPLLWMTKVKVVDLIAPPSFDASIDNTTMPLGSPETIRVTVKDAFNDELKDSLYYDVSKLSYTSDDDNVATVGSFGVITPVSIGSTTIRVSNSSGVEKSFNVTVTSGSSISPYENLNVVGEDICYEHDIFLNKKIQLTIKNNDEVVDNSEFIWQSSNPLLARVNQKGEVYGYRKTVLEDEVVTITAINKKTQQEVSKEIVVKKELPTAINTCYLIGDKQLWNQSQVTGFVGDVITIKVVFDKVTVDTNISATSSNNDVVMVTNQGSNVTLGLVEEGTSKITIQSSLVPSLNSTTEVTVKKPGAINQNNYEDVNLSIRKSIGHALMFAITQAFTFLALYMFLPNKKWWLIAIISLGAGILLASISETIQFFIPLRSGTFIDVLIDLSGVIVGLVITLGLTMLIKHSKNKKEKSAVEKKQDNNKIKETNYSLIIRLNIYFYLSPIKERDYEINNI